MGQGVRVTVRVWARVTVRVCIMVMVRVRVSLSSEQSVGRLRFVPLLAQQ